MSIRAINWAIDVCERIEAPARHRHVLLVLSVHHHEKTGACFPAYDTLANACGFSRRKVIDLIADLEANGLITKQKRRVGAFQGSNHFALFGKPNGQRWSEARVQKKAPCESANGGTLIRVQTGAPDKEDSLGSNLAKGLRVAGGRHV